MIKKLSTHLLATAKSNLVKMLFFGIAFLLFGEVWGQQVIGSFPNQDGGFEDQTGTLGATSSTTAWWLSASITGAIQNTGGRSGPKYVNIFETGSSHRTLRGPAAATFPAATQYVIQFYYRGDNNNDGTADYGDIRGGINGSTFAYTSYTTNSNQSGWTKFTGAVTPGAATATGHAVVSIVEIAAKVANFDIDDVVIYAGSSADIIAANSPGTVTVNNPSTNSLDVSWGAASGGVDGGGYVVVRYSSNPGATDDPLVNGIYEVGNAITGSGTVRFIGTATSFTDNVGLSSGTQYWYKVYTVDKAFNYSTESSGNGTTTSSGSPTLSAGTLSSGFGNQCINTTSSTIPTFTITGSDLTSADVTVSGDAVYTFATTLGGTYSNPLNITQSGGAFSQTVYVKFTPTAVTSYNGNITVGGGGASDVTTAVTGSGVNTAPTVTTTTATSISTTGASSGGASLSNTCGTITDKGVVWGLSANPTVPSANSTNDGSGTSNYTSTISGLSSNTTYNYRAYVTNSNGLTSYGSNLTFTTLKDEPSNSPSSFACGTTTTISIPLTWIDATGTTTPDGYLIRWSAISFAAITDPIDGTAVANGATAQNITQGTQTYTPNGLTSSTTYYFKIYPYTNSGSNIDYKLTSVQQTSCATLAAPWEDFETGTKTGYALGNVTCTAGSWSFNSALLGTSGSDFMNGSQSARIQSTGSISMNFDLTSGLGTVTLLHGMYGSDADGTWRLEASTDGGSTWTAFVSSTYTATASTFASQTITVNLSGNVRFRIVKLTTSSTSNRLNIDDIYVTSYAGTCNTPSTQASAISFSSVAQTTMNISCTTGDASNRLIYMNSSNSFTDPINGFSIPSANTVWANAGEQLIYNGTGSSVSVSNLSSGTIYYFRVYEYNCTGANTRFLTSTATQNPNSQTTLNPASTASVVQAVSGSEANTISSLINGTITSNSDGIQVWRFTLYDGDGTTNDADNLPTIYKSWTIQADGVNNTVPDWSTAIADRKFFLNSNTSPISGGGLINSANIPFPVSSPYITVPDDGEVDIYMRLTLANPLPANSDNKKFAFKLTQADVTVETSSTSSQLGTFSTTSDASKNVINIIATLQFINAPTTVGLGDAFTVTVSAVDANGNIDQNNTSLITLAQNTGTGTMTGGGSFNLVNGTYTWTGLTYDTEETFQVIASGGGFSAITANITVTDDDFQLFDHFNRTASSTVGIPSSGGSTAWTETEAGDGTKVQIFNNMLFIDNCISSDPSGSSGGTTTERVSFNGETYYESIFNNSDGTMNWLFNMRSNNSNLSGFAGSAYAMAFILGCDQADFTASGSDGYAVVVGNSGTTDNIKIVRFTNGLSADANVTDIVASDIDIDANYASVKVSFNPCDGGWTLYARNDGASAFTAPNVSSPAFSGPFTATNTTHTALDLKYFGAAWKHNSSCVGNDAYFDNFYIPNTNTSVAITKIWNGSVSSNWNTAANWSPCPGVPTITDNVTIPVTANNPVISASPSGLCKDLTVNANAQLTINAGQFLNAHGNVVNNGNANFGAGILQLENTPIATVTVTGSINVGNFYNSNNATLSGTVTVTDQARAETGGALNANGNLVLNNGAQLFHGTGTTVPCACEGTVNGNVVVKRNGTSSASVYNYWSTPISSASLGLLGGTNYLYNPANGTADFSDDNPGPDPGWAAASGSFTVGKGYAGQGPNPAVTFTGTANNGSLTAGVQYFTLVNGSTSPGVPYNLIGNPYPSNISATSFLTANNTKVTGAIYYWDDDNTGGTGYAANDYAIWNGTGSTGGGGRTPNGMIATAQGFFVQTLSGATSVSFTNAMRTATATTFFKTEDILPQRLWLRADNGQHTNQILVGYVDGATQDMDWFYDAQKLRGNHSVSFYSLLNDTTLLGIQGLAPLNGADPAPVPLGLYAGATGQYSIYIDSIENFPSNMPINLLDADMGLIYDLRNGPYLFQTAQGEDNDRFVLFPNEIVTALDELDNLHLNVYPNPNNGTFTVMINSGIEQEINVSLFDVTGKLIMASNQAISSCNNFIALETQVAGVYMLKVETADKTYTKRIVVY